MHDAGEGAICLTWTTRWASILPLIVVNCIILGRAEMFASKNSVVDSALDGLGMGLGFTLTLVLMGSIREMLGAGTLVRPCVMPLAVEPMIRVHHRPPGGFFVLRRADGRWWSSIEDARQAGAGAQKPDCAGCPSAARCCGG